MRCGNEGNSIMPRPPNYGQQRAERSRAARTKSEEKMRALQERTERRKAEREKDPGSTAEADPAARREP